MYAEFRDCTWIEYQFDKQKPYGWNPPPEELLIERLHHWHNTSRYVGIHFIPKSSDYVMFLDADEVCDGEKMGAWFKTGRYLDFDCLHFFAYRYQHLPSIRGERYGNTALMVKREKIVEEELFNRFERAGFFRSFIGRKMSGVLGLDGLPMIHHYSWVRTKEEFFKKIGSWGHKFDRDWSQTPDSYIFGFKKSIRIHPFCDPLAVPVEEFRSQTVYRQLPKEEFSHLILINPEKLKNLSIKMLADI